MSAVATTHRDEDLLEQFEEIDHEWWLHLASGLRMRSLHAPTHRTKLKKEWNHWLFEVTDGRYSVFLNFEKWPTLSPVLRQALPIFHEYFPVGDARFGHWYTVDGLDNASVVEIISLFPLVGRADMGSGQYIQYQLDHSQIGECLTA